MLINVYVASPDPDLNPRGGGQLPNPKEWNSTLTSETKNIYPYLYIDLGKWVAGYELSMRHAYWWSEKAWLVARKKISTVSNLREYTIIQHLRVLWRIQILLRTLAFVQYLYSIDDLLTGLQGPY